MILKNILLPVDGSEFGYSQINHAVELAKIYNSKLILLNVLDIRLLEGPLFKDLNFFAEIADFEYKNDIKNSLEERSKMILEKFGKVLSELNIPFESNLATGVISNTIANHARTADFVILGKYGENFEFETSFLGTTTETTTRLLNKPVMLVNKEYQPIKKILFAYDATTPSNKALQFITQMIMHTKYEVDVITVSDDESEGQSILDEATNYFSSYGINSGRILKYGNVVESILEVMNENKYDAIAMGAYGHSQIHQMLLGSTTTLIIRNVKQPVILYR